MSESKANEPKAHEGRTVNVRSTVEDAGHYRAGRLIPHEGIDLTLVDDDEMTREERAAAGVINAEDLRQIRRDPRCVADGYSHIPRKVWEPQELAAARARETEAAQAEQMRKQLLAQAGATAELAAASARASKPNSAKS